MSTIQVATSSQAAEISELVNAAYRGESGLQGWTSEAGILDGLRTDPERVRADIERKDSAILVKLLDRKVQGCVHLEKKDAGAAYLGMLTVNVRVQAKGNGSELMSAAEEFVKKIWHSKIMEMTVIDSRHELIAYYVRRGYRVTDGKRPFPTDPRFGISKIGALEFVVLKKEL